MCHIKGTGRWKGASQNTLINLLIHFRVWSFLISVEKKSFFNIYIWTNQCTDPLTEIRGCICKHPSNTFNQIRHICWELKEIWHICRSRCAYLINGLLSICQCSRVHLVQSTTGQKVVWLILSLLNWPDLFCSLTEEQSEAKEHIR